MINVDNADIVEQTELFMKQYQNGSSAPFLYSDYMQNSFPKLEERALAERLKQMRKVDPNVQSVYPYDVKIPKSTRELLDGDFAPARILRITQPFKGPYSNVWFGSTLDGITFRWGYVNGDSRKLPSDGLNDTTVHGFLGGATGQGKSVTLNTVLYGCCMEYPPWELEVVLSDAKIVEFKAIALTHPMPQITTVAATSDADYTISVLEEKQKEMFDRNSIFTKAAEVFKTEVKNIKDFRKVTGMCMPRVLMVFDECTAMFQNAGTRKAGKIADIIDSFARLGRNTGFHLLLTSQEISSDLPDKTLANMSLRGAMGCTAPISDKILGNEEAVSNMGLKGRLIVNTHSSDRKESIKYNQLIRVPFTPEDQISAMADRAIELGKLTKTTPVLRFYDEQFRYYEDDYKKFLESFKFSEDRILLGPPSFIMDSDEQVVRIELSGSDNESICVFANEEINKLRALKMLKLNLLRFKNARHVLMEIDPMFTANGGLDDFNTQQRYEEKSYDTSQFITVARELIYKRAMCLAADKRVFNDGMTSEQTDNLLYSIFEKGSKYDTATNRSRAFHYVNLLLSDKEIMAGLGLDPARKDVFNKKVRSIVEWGILTCEDFGCFETQITVNKMTKIFMWIFGFERLIGLVRDVKYKYVEEFKKLLFDCTASNVRFVVFTSSFEDVSQLAQAFGSFLLEDISEKQQGQIKCADDYPQHLDGGLMVLFKPSKNNDDRLVKFKKYMFKGEN